MPEIAHHGAVRLAPVETSEALAAKFANNMDRLLVSNLLSPLNERCHLIDLVLDQAGPVLAVNVASLAVEMLRIGHFVRSHGCLAWKAVLAIGV